MYLVLTFSASTGPNHAGPTQLFIGSLHVNITEDDLETIFTEFGELDKVTLARDEAGISKGYAYVKYVLFVSFIF